MNMMDKKEGLMINVRSFSYKKGIPEDLSGNGGGFVFDCRGILNPGRIEEYKTKTGRDKEVIEFLEKKTEMPVFLRAIYQVVGITVSNYTEREFTNLEVNFGCTGGQHRSVYAADRMAEYLKSHFTDAHVNIKHVVQEEKKWINKPY